MLRTRFFSLLTALACFAGLAAPALAAQVDSGSVYCFAPEDFEAGDDLTGICITHLPENFPDAVKLGDRVLRPGDILTADQLAQMTFESPMTEGDLSACVTYLPIHEDHVAPPATMTISIRGKEDLTPVAEDTAHETYKNLPVEGKLKARDPENQALTFTVTRDPRRGEVTIREDGSFTYTPKKNKVGTDSFVYTATDAGGNVSREATVTIQILKPTDATQYTDTLGRDCRFAAEWMKNTGIFVGEKVGDNPCFNPDKPVNRGEFLTMLVKSLDIPTEETPASLREIDAPDWLRPYLAAALRSGLTDGLPQTDSFDATAPITGAEAAVLLQNALDLPPAEDSLTMWEEAAPVWAEDALAVMASHGFALSPTQALTREQAAICLYQASRLGSQAPGIRTIQAVS